MHVPHDVDLPRNRQLLLARKDVKEEDLAENSPDHLGAPLELADDSVPTPVATSSMPPSVAPKGNGVVQASLREREPNLPTAQEQPADRVSTSQGTPEDRDEDKSKAGIPIHGTVVLDVEQGGIVVPSFIGKTVRTAVESAEASGLDLDVVGSGMGRQQSPSPGTHVQAGSRVTVNFGR